MNHEQFGRCVGQTLRLEPQAVGPDGAAVDDDWTVAAVNRAEGSATLRNLTRGGDVVVGFDHVRSYDTDPARGQGFGFLNMLWQLRVARDGRITGRPIPVRPGAPPAPEFHAFVVNDGEADRHLIWASRDPAVAQLIEGEPRQLYDTFFRVCDALRVETAREPQFDAPSDIRHEIVWELRADHLSKHKLLGGMNGQHALHVLVLTANRARLGIDPVANVAHPEVEAVDLNYPDRSGLQDRLAAEGFKLHWVREEKVGRQQGEGWEVVIAEDGGRRVTFRVSPGAPGIRSVRANPDEATHVAVNSQPVLITKRDAARRQLDAAIRLYFEGGDELAIHTLVGAVHILMTDLSKAAKLESILDRYIVPDWRWKFEKAIRAPQNFIKHAATDAEATLDFNPHNTELMLFIDVEMFKELAGSATDPMRAFHAYAAATFGRESFERFPQDALDDLAVRATEMSKGEFFTFVMSLMAHGRATGAIE